MYSQKSVTLEDHSCTLNMFRNLKKKKMFAKSLGNVVYCHPEGIMSQNSDLGPSYIFYVM